MGKRARTAIQKNSEASVRLAPTVWIMYAQQGIKPPPLQPLLLVQLQPQPHPPPQHQQLLVSQVTNSALTSVVVVVLAALESLPAMFLIRQMDTNVLLNF